MKRFSFSLSQESEIFSRFYTYFNEIDDEVQLIESRFSDTDYEYKRLGRTRSASNFVDSSQKWVKFIFEYKKIPAPFVKKMQGVAEVFLKMTRMPNKFGAWWEKNYSKFQILLIAKSWPIKEEGSEEKYKIDSFIIHNTLQLTDDDLLKTNASIEVAIKFLKNSGIPKVSQALYGDIFIVGRLLKSGTMAWYYNQEDKIYLRPLLSFGRGDVHNLIHEIGHRYYKKILSPTSKRDWESYFIKLKYSGEKTLNPKQEEDLEQLKNLKVGDIFPVQIQGMKRGGPLLVKEIIQTGSSASYDWSLTFVIGNSKGSTKMPLRTIINHWKKETSRFSNFPTDYSSTSEEEFFCECFAMYAMKSLEVPWKEEFQEIVG